MALRSLTLEKVKAINPEQRTRYFERYAGYFPENPVRCYAIQVGSKTFHSADTMELRQMFDKYVDGKD